MTRKTIHFAGCVIANDEGRLAVDTRRIDTRVSGDYGADPLGDGTFRMVPSGDIVSYEERCRRLKRA